MRVFAGIAAIAIVVGIRLWFFGGIFEDEIIYVPPNNFEERIEENNSQEQVSQDINPYLRQSGDAGNGSTSLDLVFLNPVEGWDNEQLVFHVTMDTHSLDLEKFPLNELTIIENSKGLVISKGFDYEIIIGGHHLSGYLSIANNTENGQLIEDGVEWIKLTITGVPKVRERSFYWAKDYLNI